jgi:SAM-dependent methyltransferase/uncharacterized protein YbaR (Trm112 family)
MLKTLVPLLACPTCGNDRSLESQSFSADTDGHIQDGVLVCRCCGTWYSIDDGLLELVPRSLAEQDDLSAFSRRWKTRLDLLGLRPSAEPLSRRNFQAQLKQREHFDWYAENGDQSYCDYETTPFWKAVDAAAFGQWRPQIAQRAWLLDVGCANGRSAFRLIDSGMNLVGFDISKKMVRQAIRRATREGRHSVTTFLVADGNAPPFAPSSFDFVLTYGVLHHLPDPAAACRQIQRILKPGGTYFGSENNKSVFRGLFDLLMKVVPLWTEEAGAEPLISRKMLDAWHTGLPAAIHSTTSVFLPPHLLNITGSRIAPRLLRISDKVASRIPLLRNQGGLIVFEIRKEGDSHEHITNDAISEKPFENVRRAARRAAIAVSD